MSVVNDEQNPAIRNRSDCLAYTSRQGRVRFRGSKVNVVDWKVPVTWTERKNCSKRGFARGTMPDDYCSALFEQCSLDFGEHGRGIDAPRFVFFECWENTRRSADIHSLYHILHAAKRFRRHSEVEVIHPKPGVEGSAQPSANFFSENDMNVLAWQPKSARLIAHYYRVDGRRRFAPRDPNQAPAPFELQFCFQLGEVLGPVRLYGFVRRSRLNGYERTVRLGEKRVRPAPGGLFVGSSTEGNEVGGEVDVDGARDLLGYALKEARGADTEFDGVFDSGFGRRIERRGHLLQLVDRLIECITFRRCYLQGNERKFLVADVEIDVGEAGRAET